MPYPYMDNDDWYERYPGALPGTLGPPAAAPAQPPLGGGYGMTTPKERAYHMQNMPDITSKKRALARQHALSEELRQSALPTRRMDWASQAARGLSGIGSALIDKRAAKDQGDLSERIRQHWLNVPGMRGPEEIDWGV